MIGHKWPTLRKWVQSTTLFTNPTTQKKPWKEVMKCASVDLVAEFDIHENHQGEYAQHKVKFQCKEKRFWNGPREFGAHRLDIQNIGVHQQLFEDIAKSNSGGRHILSLWFLLRMNDNNQSTPELWVKWYVHKRSQKFLHRFYNKRTNANRKQIWSLNCLSFVLLQSFDLGVCQEDALTKSVIIRYSWHRTSIHVNSLMAM